MYLNRQTDEYILKGGTSLMMCYKLDRFSEDIDLDCVRSKQIRNIVDTFCELKGYKYRIAKDTNTVKRFMINYGREEKPLKIEVSYRKMIIDKSEYTKINGITVYKIDDLCRMKNNAYNSRDKIRDLYDLTFICNNYWDSLSENTIKGVRDCVEYKGLEQFDYLINQQNDELIDNNKLAEEFLTMYDRLGLMIDENEKEYISDNVENNFYYLETNQAGLDNLYKSGIDFEAHESDTKDMFIVRVSTADKEKATLIINSKPPTIK